MYPYRPRISGLVQNQASSLCSLGMVFPSLWGLEGCFLLSSAVPLLKLHNYCFLLPLFGSHQRSPPSFFLHPCLALPHGKSYLPSLRKHHYNPVISFLRGMKHKRENQTNQRYVSATPFQQGKSLGCLQYLFVWQHISFEKLTYYLCMGLLFILTEDIIPGHLWTTFIYSYSK